MRFPSQAPQPEASGGPSRRPPTTDRAVALVTVLGILAIMTVLIMAMFSMSQTEQQGARAYEATQRSRMLADVTVNSVINQLRTATRAPGLAWASQPGAIRRYDGSGNFHSGFRLYSSPAMTVEGGTEADFAADTPPSDWNSDSNRARFVDLNSPVFRADLFNPDDPSGEVFFPIVDPRSVGQVEGFDFNADAVAGARKTGKSSTARLPMPVEWIYLLEDGTMGTLDGNGRFTGRRGGQQVSATRDNPITGRIAFWTDDETGKLNVNTASEPTFWDTPRAEGDDRNYGRFQPVHREFQRYPGHPATTALSPVLFGGQDIGVQAKENIYRILPHVGPGGSVGATVPWVSSGGSVDIVRERLYASVDELLFPADGRAQVSGSAHAQLLPPSVINRRQFFLTAHSRAPEVTLYNTPRIAVWPVAEEARANTHSRTAFDEVIRFATKIGPGDQERRFPNHVDPGVANRNDYIFRRNDEDKGYRDFEEGLRVRQLYAYLQHLTDLPVPGFGGSFQQKYGPNRNQILTQIYDYIRCINLYDDSLTFSGSGQGGTSNTHREFTDARGSGGFGKVTPTKIPVGHPQGGGTLGFGRSYAPAEVAIHFICNADAGTAPNAHRNGGESGQWNGIRYYSNFPPLSSTDPAQNRYDTVDGIPGNNAAHPGYDRANWNHALEENTPLQPGERRIQAMLLVEFTSVMLGWHGIGSELAVHVSGLENLRVNGIPLGLPGPTRIGSNGAVGRGWHERQWGGHAGFRGWLNGRRSPEARNPANGKVILPADSGYSGNNRWPFIGIPITIDVSAGETMQFSGGRVIVRVDAEGNPTINDVQQIIIDFPPATIPAPRLIRHGTVTSFGSTADPNSTNAEATNPPFWWTFRHDGSYGFPQGSTVSPHRGRLFRIHRNPWHSQNGANTSAGVPHEARHVASGSWIHPHDTVRSMVPWHGDYRLVAGRQTVDESVFQPVPGYTSASEHMAHLLTTTAGASYMHGFSNLNPATQLHSLAGGPNYGFNRWPKFPDNAAARAAVLATGDFDNGLGRIADGAYINKPDEGNTRGLQGEDVPYFVQDWVQDMPGPQYFSPNRQIPSPGMFGSLPTGVLAANGQPPVPWRTLLFRPQPGHFGWDNGPRDHLWLDLFWMPVVEPYAVSEPFSTAGKVNLNYAMMPFSYIERSTAVRGLIGDETVLAIPSGQPNHYKSNANATGFRRKIDIDQTLSQFRQRFDQGGIFRAGSQICEVHLVPEGASLAALQNGTFWNQEHRLTGDNARERPYTNLYPRVTTKSNTYRVHYRVQPIRKARSTDPAVFDPDNDAIVGEDRGSVLIERYINPTRQDIPNYAAVVHNAGVLPPLTLDQLYEYRVISERRFAP